MLIFNATNRSWKVLLGAAGAIPWVVSWQQSSSGTPYVPDTATGVTNGTTPVTLIAAPASGFYRQAKQLFLHNSSGGGVVATLRYSDGASDRDLSFSLDNGDLLQYSDGEGFRIFDSTGKLKVTSGGAAGAHASTHQHGGSDYLNWTVVSPSALGSTTHDWAPGTGDVVRADASTPVDVTGLAGGSAGMHRRIVHVGSANTLTLKHQDAGSAAGNRFIGTGGADVVLYPGDQADVWYDGVTSRWRASLA